MEDTDIWDIFNTLPNDSLENSKDKDSEPSRDNKILDNKKQLDNIDSIIKDFCEFCNTNTLASEDGKLYCVGCGIFQQKRLNHNVEYRYYGDSDNKSSNPERVGMPTNYLLPESSLGSLIGYNYRHKSYNFRKMMQYNSWNAMPYKERSQWKVYSDIAIKAKKGGLPSIIIEESKSYYKIISETSISRGSNRLGIIAACVFQACKKIKVPRSAKEIANIFNIEMQDMTHGIKRFKEIWRISNSNRLKVRTSNALDYIDRFCSNLSVPIDIKHIAEFIAVKAKTNINNLVEDNTSPSVAAGSIYLACSLCNQNITKRQVSIACKISEVTIAKCYKKLYLNRAKVVPRAACVKYNIHL